MQLPDFKYHPDPISTGSIEASDETCECCGRATGYVYSLILYAEEEVEFICPWCISDGSAAQKFDGTFSDDYPLHQADLPESVVAEVCERTPGYSSWQQEEWQSHCGDACEFHGQAPREELKAFKENRLSEFLQSAQIDPEFWDQILDGYPSGNPLIFKFKCRQCKEPIYTADFM